MTNRELFLENAKEYFKEDTELFLKKMSDPLTHGFFLNQAKGKKEDLFKEIDFPYEPFNEYSFRHENVSIGKSRAYELGIIYPQGLEAGLPAMLPEMNELHLAVDLCASPGGKSINILNRMKQDAVLVSNEYNYPRVQALTSNIERLGFDNVIITNKDTAVLADELEGNCNLVILDAPCSGEGMIRKYPEILDEYSNENIRHLASLQKELLENAYQCLKKDGQLLYSTCTYSFKEDEEQIETFLLNHSDMERVSDYHKYSFLNDTEGQFFVLLRRKSENTGKKLKYLKTVRNALVEGFIKENIDIDEYYLYKLNDLFYIALFPLIDLGKNIIRCGIPLGKIVKDRFEPEHGLYRANNIKFRNKIDLSDSEYRLFVSGNEILSDRKDGYVQVAYHHFPLGFGKVSKGRLKNKYPKGLRKTV